MPTIPPIQRRVKANARRLKLRIEHHQVFLTIPPRTPAHQIEAFLQQSEHWLITTWNKNYANTVNAQSPAQGECLSLPLLAEQLEIRLHAEQNQFEAILKNNQLLVHADQASMLVKQWVRQQAILYLPKRLKQLADQYGFSYSACQVRHAKTRWGSCSAKRGISLNAALLLLPVTLVDYVILHELCHTRQLNHSARFWHEMQSVDPLYVEHRQQLKLVRLPAWWHACSSG